MQCSHENVVWVDVMLIGRKQSPVVHHTRCLLLSCAKKEVVARSTATMAGSLSLKGSLGVSSMPMKSTQMTAIGDEVPATLESWKERFNRQGEQSSSTD